MLDDIFEEFHSRVKANISGVKDAKGITRKIKMTVAPTGQIDDDDAWRDAATGGTTTTESYKDAAGRTRTKSLSLSGEDEAEQEKSVVIVERVLGISEEAPKKAKKRSVKADTIAPEVNGKEHVETK